MKKIHRFATATLLFLMVMSGANVVCSLSSAHAEEAWKQEFAAICAETHNAMTLSVVELKDYIDRCEKLRERLSELEGQEGNSQRKVYEKRLKMCRDLYVFTLEFKER